MYLLQASFGWFAAVVTRNSTFVRFHKDKYYLRTFCWMCGRWAPKAIWIWKMKMIATDFHRLLKPGINRQIGVTFLFYFFVCSLELGNFKWPKCVCNQERKRVREALMRAHRHTRTRDASKYSFAVLFWNWKNKNEIFWKNVFEHIHQRQSHVDNDAIQTQSLYCWSFQLWAVSSYARNASFLFFSQERIPHLNARRHLVVDDVNVLRW